MQTYKILEQDTVLLSQPLLIEKFGRAGAQFLSQLHYWLKKNESIGHEQEGVRWIYNSAESWAEQLHLSVRQIRRLIAKFIETGILRVQKLNPCKSVRTNYYSINYQALDAVISTKSFLSRSIVHEDILSPSSCHNGTIYIETKITNKDFNKSESELKNSKEQRTYTEQEQVKQVEPVKKTISKIKKGRVGEQEKKNINFPESKGKEIEKTLPKTSTAQNMLKVWNAVLGEKSPVWMSKDLAPQLVSAFSTKFEKDLKQWQRYCELIKTSDYLMREEFDLSIFWALKFSTIDRLRAGGLGVKPELIDVIHEEIVDNSLVDEMICNLNESEKVKSLRRTIASAVGFANYHSWFHQASFIEREEKILLLAPNAFVESKWEELFPWIYKNHA